MYKITFFLILLLSILFPIKENYINAIIIDGNKAFSYNELISILKLKNPGLFSRSKFSPKMYTRDIQSLIKFYKSRCGRQKRLKEIQN